MGAKHSFVYMLKATGMIKRADQSSWNDIVLLTP